MQTLSPPWYTYQKKVSALFKGDADVEVSDLVPGDSGEGTYKLTVKVKKPDKAYAIKSVLNDNASFGNVTIVIKVLDDKGEDPTPTNSTAIALVQTAFEGNPLFDKIHIYSDVPFLERYIYCVFKKEIIQFFDDNLSDYNGNFNGIVADVAREVCVSQIYDCPITYCTRSDNDN